MLAFLKVFDIVPGWVYLLVIAGMFVGVLAERSMRHTEEKAHAITTANFADYRSRVQERESVRAQTAMLETNKQRDLEKLRRTAAQKAQDELIAETSRTAAAVAAADTRRKLLGATIDALTSPSAAGGGASGDSAALRKVEVVASALGGLLKTCRAEGDSDARELEQLAGQVRALITQYEGLLVSPPATAAQPGG